MRPNEDQVEGKLNQATGAVKEEVGRATGNETLERDGAQERVSGIVEEQVGDAKHDVGDALQDAGRAIGG